MTPYYIHERWQHLLAAIRAAPDDDLPRLVAADFIEENGDAERAEFIRRQIELFRMAGSLTLDNRRDAVRQWLNRVIDDGCLAVWVESHEDWSWSGDQAETWVDARNASYGVSCGFVHTVSGPLSVLHGGECGRCRGRGNTIVHRAHDPYYGTCVDCHGTGRTPGVLAELLRREPITAAGIEVTDVGLWQDDTAGVADEYRFAWWRLSSWHLNNEGQNGLGNVPDDVFDAIADLYPENRMIWGGPPSNQHVGFLTEDSARLALGEALCRLHGPKSEVTT